MVAGVAGAIEPPVPRVAVNMKVTLAPTTGLLLGSRTMTDGAAATAVATVADWEVALLPAMLFAPAARPDALNVTVFRPAIVAVTVLLFAPATVPSVHEVNVAT